MGVPENELTALRRELQAEQSDPDAARWRRLEAMAGFDPDEAPEAFISDLLAESEHTGWPVLEELAASSRKRALQDLHTLRECLHREGVAYRIAELERLRHETEALVADVSRPPWHRATEAARKARQQWNLNGEVVSNNRLAEILGLPVAEFDEGRDGAHQAPYSASVRAEDGQERLILNRRPITSRRFAACRLLGDRLFMSAADSPLAAATDAYTARQKFQRAFAQELLCPFEALREAIDTEMPTEQDIEGAAERFQVSPLLVRTALVNHHVLPRDALDEVA